MLSSDVEECDLKEGGRWTTSLTVVASSAVTFAWVHMQTRLAGPSALLPSCYEENLHQHLVFLANMLPSINADLRASLPRLCAPTRLRPGIEYPELNGSLIKEGFRCRLSPKTFSVSGFQISNQWLDGAPGYGCSHYIQSRAATNAELVLTW